MMHDEKQPHAIFFPDSKSNRCSTSNNLAKLANHAGYKLGLTALAAASVCLPNQQTVNAIEPNDAIAQNSVSQKSTSSFNRPQLQSELGSQFNRSFLTNVPQIKFTSSFPENRSRALIASIPNSKATSAVNNRQFVSQQRIHQVQPGDTINRIARMYQVTKDEIVELNQLANSNVIFVNQQLEIPTSNSTNLADGRSPLAVSLPKKTGNKAFEANSENNSVKLAQLATTSPALNSARSDSSASLANPHITRLKAELNSLRKQDREESSEKIPARLDEDLPPTTNTKEIEPETKTSLAANVDAQIPNNLTSSLLEDAIALTLPPLPPSTEYLPRAFEGYIWPAEGVLTSGYGWRWGRVHRGIDIAAPIGTPILAAASGKVINVGYQSGYGNLVKLEHLDGSVTVYAHNHRNLVTHGQWVEQGEQIAEMGNTGHSTGPHVHFEIITKDRKAIDPLALLKSK